MKIILTTVLTVCLTLLVVNLADALIECYSCGSCGDDSGESNDDSSSCGGSSNTLSGCSYCITTNQTNPNEKSILSSSCGQGTYDPTATDTCGHPGNGNGQPWICTTACNTTLCNYPCTVSAAAAHLLMIPFLHQIIIFQVFMLLPVAKELVFAYLFTY